MSGGHRPGDVPPDVPPEYAEAYRRGYERALGEAGADPSGAAGQHPPQDAEPTTRLDPDALAAARRNPGDEGATQYDLGPLVEQPLAPSYLSEEDDDPHRTARRTLVPVLLAAVAIALIAGAYGVGRLFSEQVSDVEVAEPDGGVSLGDGAAPDDTAKPGRYDGPVEDVAIGGARASCQAKDSVDAAGRPVSYEPQNAYDGDPATAWRCNGRGVGQKLTVTLPDRVTIGAVGLIPGYAKTDPQSGADRYAENNRITKVRWVFSDGTRVVQKMSGGAKNRDLRTIRIPRTDADAVTIVVLASKQGPRNTIAISEVRVAEVAR